MANDRTDLMQGTLELLILNTLARESMHGYGIVSAHSTPDVNDLVSEAIATHRQQRETLIAALDKESITAPLPAAGYQLPFAVDDPTDAANLAVRMENDAATAWRAAARPSPRRDRRGRCGRPRRRRRGPASPGCPHL